MRRGRREDRARDWDCGWTKAPERRVPARAVRQAAGGVRRLRVLRP